MAEKVARVNTLAHLLEQHGYIPEPQVAQIFVQVLRDLEQHHGQAELHLDIRPQNIVRGTGGSFRLTGYGESRLGNPRYMSPERCRRGKLDGRSDLYSLGVVLFEAATGKPLFDTNLSYELLDAHLNQRPPAPRSIRPEISADLQRIILMALAKDPSDRFQSAKEFRESLEQLAKPGTEGHSVPMHPEPGRSRLTARHPGKRATQNAELGNGSAETVVRSKTGRGSAVLVRILLALLVTSAVVLLVVLLRFGAVSRSPLLVGASKAAAEALSRKAGLVLLVQGERDGSVAPGVIAEQSPKPGSRLRKGDTVKVWVGSGMVGVPDLTNRQPAEVRMELTRLGMSVVRVDSAYSDAVKPGLVVSTKPVTPARLGVGSDIVLVVAEGRATCAKCSLRREKEAKFCIRCGHKYEP